MLRENGQRLGQPGLADDAQQDTAHALVRLRLECRDQFRRVGAGVSLQLPAEDRKSTRLNSSHANISYAVFCLKKKHNNNTQARKSGLDAPPPRARKPVLVEIRPALASPNTTISRTYTAPPP